MNIFQEFSLILRIVHVDLFFPNIHISKRLQYEKTKQTFYNQLTTIERISAGLSFVDYRIIINKNFISLKNRREQLDNKQQQI